MNRLWAVAIALLSVMGSGQGGTLVQFDTVLGGVTVELLDEEKPVTVENFLRYVSENRYQGLFFHRLDPGFVLQGGGFLVTKQDGGTAIDFVETFGTITNEFNVGERVSNTFGTIAMARVGGQVNSASSQWFFNLGDNQALDEVDGGFTVFGRVVAGESVLQQYNEFTTLTSQTPEGTTNLVVNASQVHRALGELPVLTRDVTFEDLISVNIRILDHPVEMQISPDGTLQWNSVRGRSYELESAPSPLGPWELEGERIFAFANRVVREVGFGEQARFFRVQLVLPGE